MNKKHNTRFTAGISPRKERKPGQVRISEMEEAHNADMRALVAAKKMNERMKKRCITIRVGSLTITGLPTTVRLDKPDKDKSAITVDASEAMRAGDEPLINIKRL